MPHSIRVADHCKLLFEVGNLIYASPATVSRCGIVFVDPKNLGVEPFMWKWLNERPDKVQVTPWTNLQYSAFFDCAA